VLVLPSSPRAAARGKTNGLWPWGPKRFRFLLGWLFMAVGCFGVAAADDFISGADFSHLAFFESRGVGSRDGGQPKDGFAMLKERGLNCIRLRLFTSSASQAQADPYNYINNLDYTLQLAQRVKSAGLQFMLDFHYSDTWADPSHQSKPAGWTNLTFSQLTQQIRAYSSNCIASFKAAGAMPDFVQVGNEITSGILWPDGRVGGVYDTPAQWVKLGQLLTNAIAGIEEAAGAQMPKLIVHIDRGGDWAGTQWFFDHLLQQQVQFDFIGESYYPFWHGSLDNLRNCLTNAAARYCKPMIVAETDFPWTNSTNIFGIPASPNGQVQYTAALALIVRGMQNGLGSGIIWWGAEYQTVPGLNLAGFDKRSFFDATGNILPVADAFGQLVAPLRLTASLNTGSLVLQWPLSGAGMLLTTTTDLRPSGSWLPVTNGVQSTGAVLTTTLPLNSTQACFYRMQSK